MLEACETLKNLCPIRNGLVSVSGAGAVCLMLPLLQPQHGEESEKGREKYRCRTARHRGAHAPSARVGVDWSRGTAVLLDGAGELAVAEVVLALFLEASAA